ncbi:MAG: hypothetical protein V4674_00235 [Patescibacteria group bacterium]
MLNGAKFIGRAHEVVSEVAGKVHRGEIGIPLETVLAHLKKERGVKNVDVRDRKIYAIWDPVPIELECSHVDDSLVVCEVFWVTVDTKGHVDLRINPKVAPLDAPSYVVNTVRSDYEQLVRVPSLKVIGLPGLHWPERGPELSNPSGHGKYICPEEWRALRKRLIQYLDMNIAAQKKG